MSRSTRRARQAAAHKGHHPSREAPFSATAMLDHVHPPASMWRTALSLGPAGFNEIVRQRREKWPRDERFRWGPDRDRAGIVVRSELDHTSADANLAGQDLRGMDLRGYDLTHAYMAKARLTGANLAGQDLSYTILSGATLDRANLQGTRLFRTILRGAHLRGTDLRNAHITCDLSPSSYGEGVWRDVLVDGAHFDTCTISGLDMTLIGDHVRFTGCRWRHHVKLAGGTYEMHDRHGAHTKRRMTEHMPVRLGGRIAYLELAGGRVHSLVADLPGCTFAMTGGDYVWAELHNMQSVSIDGRGLADHGGQVLCAPAPTRVDAPLWDELKVGGVLTLAKMPARVLAQRESGIKPAAKRHDWGHAHQQLLSRAAELA